MRRDRYDKPAFRHEIEVIAPFSFQTRAMADHSLAAPEPDASRFLPELAVSHIEGTGDAGVFLAFCLFSKPRRRCDSHCCARARPPDVIALMAEVLPHPISPANLVRPRSSTEPHISMSAMCQLGFGCKVIISEERAYVVRISYLS